MTRTGQPGIVPQQRTGRMKDSPGRSAWPGPALNSAAGTLLRPPRMSGRPN